MHKRAMITIICFVVVIAVALICVIPRFRPVDATMQAAKFNGQGKSVGTYEVAIRGNRKGYLFGKDFLELSVSPFDDLTGFFSDGEIRTLPGDGAEYILYTAINENTQDVVTVEFVFTSDMDRWLFLNVTEQSYYVASVDGKYSTQELLEFFQSLIPSNWAQ